MPLLPRAVLVTRPTELKALVAHHGTLSQARFFLESRGQDLEVLEQHLTVLEEKMIAIARSRQTDEQLVDGLFHG